MYWHLLVDLWLNGSLFYVHKKQIGILVSHQVMSIACSFKLGEDAFVVHIL